MERMSSWLRLLLTIPTGPLPEASLGGLAVALILALLRRGKIGSGWTMFIGVLAAPVERDLCRSENKSLAEDNERLARENQRLRHALGYSDESNDGSLESEDGTLTSH